MAGDIRFGTTFGMRGYFAVMYDDDGPINSGIGSYKTIDGAIQEARDWARAEFGEQGKYHLDRGAREESDVQTTDRKRLPRILGK